MEKLDGSTKKQAPRWLHWAREVLDAEGQALQSLAPSLGASFEHCCTMIHGALDQKGKVVVVGLGKSGHVARKIAATLTSTGSSALFMHATEALHGDLGLIAAGDVVLALAASGETQEVLDACDHARQRGAQLCAFTTHARSSLARKVDAALILPHASEADPHSLVPTSSALLSLALGDALAVALMRARHFTPQDFAAVHPGGQLGLHLASVHQLMRPSPRSLLTEQSTLVDVLGALAEHNFGLAPVFCSQNAQLMGAVSDGDVRRHLLARPGPEAFHAPLRHWMSTEPKTISASSSLKQALELMNRHSITTLFVLPPSNNNNNKETRAEEVQGLICMHDILRGSVRHPNSYNPLDPIDLLQP